MSKRRLPRSLRNILLHGLGIISALLLLLVIIYFGFFSQPDLFDNGEVNLDRLTNDVEVIVDQNQIPHISADNPADLFRAVGYVQAARHLTEMDRLLRIATGQMAAAHGKEFINMDIAARRIGFPDKARQIQSQLSPQALEIFKAYCEGVNAFIKTQKKSVAQQFRLAGYQPLEWDPDGCLAVWEMQHWISACQWGKKIVLYKAYELLGQERAVAGFPLVDGWPQSQAEYKDAFFPALNRLYQAGMELRRAAGLFPGRDELGVWAVANRKYASGQAVLGFESSYFDLRELLFDLSSPEFQMYGLFAPGIPTVLIGCKEELAWGFNCQPDHAVDLVVISITSSREQYLAADGWHRLTKRIEKITVKNAPDRTVNILQAGQQTLLESPVTDSDSLSQTIALAWRGVSANEINGRVAVMLGQNPAEIVQGNAALNGFVYTVPGSTANITGENPVETEPTLISERLTGFTTSDSLMARNFNAGLPAGFFYPDYQSGRMAAITRQCEQMPPFTIAGASRISTLNMDNYFARILKNVRPAVSDTLFTRKIELSAFQALCDWDGEYRPAAIGPVIYRAFVNILMRNIYGDELDLVDPETYRQFAGSYDFSMRNLTLLLEKGESSWFDNLSTPGLVEWQGEIIRQSFCETVEFLEKRYSANLSEWQWERVGRDFQVGELPGKRRRDNNVQPARTMVISAAGPESEIFISSVAHENPEVIPSNLFRNRFDLMRNDARVLTLKTKTGQLQE